MRLSGHGLRRPGRPAAVVLGAIVTALVWAPGGLHLQQRASAGTPAPARVAVLVLENRSYGQVIGNPSAPYLNALARRYALATGYYALAHPSLPNYLALMTGSTGRVRLDCTRCRVDRPSLLGQLDATGVSWRAYFQALPHDRLRVARAGTYTPHLNPLVYLSDVRDSATDAGRISPFTRLGHDLAHRALPRFSWIAPDTAHDGHSSLLSAADRYAAHLVPELIRAVGPHGVVYVTWDEGARVDHAGRGGAPGGGRVALIAAGPMARRHARTAVPADHYALLRTIEATYGLRALGRAAAPGTPLLTSLLRR
jgi:phosphatidylinositol-3-phosphatase